MPCSGFLCARVPCTSGASESDPGGCREGSRQLRWVWPLSGCSSAMGGCHTRGGKDGRLFIGMRCFIASPSSRGLERLEIPGVPNCWAQFAGMLPSSCEAPVPLSLTKSTHSSFLPGAQAAGTRLLILLSHFPNIQHTKYCVSALPVPMTRAGYFAVLGSHALPTLTPLLLLGSWVGGHAQVPLGPACILSPL